MVPNVAKVLDAAPAVTGMLVTVLLQAIIKAERKDKESVNEASAVRWHEYGIGRLEDSGLEISVIIRRMVAQKSAGGKICEKSSV